MDDWDMLNSMRYGKYIFFAIFSAIGRVFICWVVPETKDKTLEELDRYFGGGKGGIAEKDRGRMARINEQLGLGQVEKVEDLVDEKEKESCDEKMAWRGVVFPLWFYSELRRDSCCL
ncbi:hypothetical protein BJX70DRAFT_367435 [Aspergillus crustosus]